MRLWVCTETIGYKLLVDSTPKTCRTYLKGQGTYCSKLVIRRVIIRVTPFSALITLLITYLLSPLPLQVTFKI